MGEVKSEGTLRISRSSIGQEQIDDPASIADDFNPSVNSPQTNYQFAGAGVFGGDSRSCDEAREPSSLPYSPFVRGLPAFFQDSRDFHPLLSGLKCAAR